jgi:hypothetical protein
MLKKRGGKKKKTYLLLGERKVVQKFEHALKI